MKTFGVMCSLVWRATVLTPFCTVWFILLVSAWTGRFSLPFLIGAGCYVGDWKATVAYSLLWVIAVGLCCSVRFARPFEEYVKSA